MTPTLLQSFKRLTDLLDEPEAIDVLAPLIKREIHYRLLTSDQAGRLGQLAEATVLSWPGRLRPLQYQKWLRLNEARRWMLHEGFNAAQAAFEIGYESPSQFSRECSRLFGAPPKRDVVSLRTKPASVG